MKRAPLTLLFPGGDSVPWNVLNEETLHDLGLMTSLDSSA